MPAWRYALGVTIYLHDSPLASCFLLSVSMRFFSHREADPSTFKHTFSLPKALHLLVSIFLALVNRGCKTHTPPHQNKTKMASPMSVLSRTLQNISLSKIRELDSRRLSYESRKQAFLDKANASSNPRDRLTCLLEGCKELARGSSTDPSAQLDNIERWLAQSKHDASIPESKLASFDSQLCSKLDVQSRRLDMAHLYSRLLTEWMEHSSSSSSSPSPDSPATVSVAESQRNRLTSLITKFESVVFSPLSTSESSIHAFLDRLFPENDTNSQKQLSSLRSRIKNDTTLLMNQSRPFTPTSLSKCLKGLLNEDILSDEKRAILQNFLESEVAQAEIADVLNMRFADIKRWEWNAGPKGIPVMPRPGLNGKYRIWADDDILQMIFVQYIGVKLAAILKDSLKGFMEGVWKRDQDGHRAFTERVRERRRYWLNYYDSVGDGMGVEGARKSTYLERFFCSSLPGSEEALGERGGGGGAYDDDGDGTEDGENEDDWEDGGVGWAVDRKLPKKGTNIRQQLLRQLTAEMYIHRLRGVTHQSNSNEKGTAGGSSGPVALIQTDIQWFGTSIPHSTAYAVMRYLGFPEDWISFFQEYLEAPLNLDEAIAAASSSSSPENQPAEPKGPRTRKRGVPMAHSSEKLIGEMLLFCMDLAVHRETGILLYRLHDDIWLCGEPETVARAWGVMQEYADVFGLEFNKSKTGSVVLPGGGGNDLEIIKEKLPTGQVTVGFLRLLPESGKWEIDQTRVKAHVDQLEKQLAECKSVLAWVQTWNTCIGRFFSHTFGEPAHCLGVEHVDAILDTYSGMLKRLLPPNGDVVGHVKSMIQANLSLTESAIIPDAFIHLPEQLGGLGLRNPFVPLLLVRDNLSKAPEELLKEFLRKEYEKYLEYKKTFDETPSWKLRHRLEQICPDDDVHSESESELDSDEDEHGEDDSDSESETDAGKATPPPNPKKVPTITPREANKFMTLNEFAFFREHTSRDLRDLYQETLLGVPEGKGISLDKNTADALRDALSLSSSPSVDESSRGSTSGYARRGGRGGRAGYNGGGRSTSTGKSKIAPLTPENKWFVALYAEELLETYGGLSLVDKQFLPGGVLSMMREKKVTWQMVL